MYSTHWGVTKRKRDTFYFLNTIAHFFSTRRYFRSLFRFSGKMVKKGIPDNKGIIRQDQEKICNKGFPSPIVSTWTPLSIADNVPVEHRVERSHFRVGVARAFTGWD